MDHGWGCAYGERMDIRTKLTFVLVAVAIASMAALAVTMSAGAGEALRERRLAQLEGLAEAESDALGQITVSWRDQVSLIASRTQLRESLDAYNRTGAPGAAERIGRSLSDATSSVDLVRSAAVYDARGGRVAAAGDGREIPRPPGNPPPDTVILRGISSAPDGTLRAELLTDLLLEGRSVGSLTVALDAGALRRIAEDRTGLGESGETLIVVRDPEGRPRVVRTRGHGRSPGASPATGEGSELLRLALEGPEGRYWSGVTDEEGHPVWAAVRRVPEIGWTVVVKMDAEEARAPLVAFLEQLVRVGLALAAFAILFATVLALRFSRPIHDLAEVARRLGGGELDARATVAAEDEVGLLARTFNRMAEELESRVTDLRQFQILFESSLDMLCIAGTDGYLKKANPAFERTLGWSRDELLSRPIVSFVHPDDADRTAREIEKLARGIPTVSFKNRWLCADGSYKHVLWTSHPDPEAGLLYSVGRDVTRLREERERFERALQASSTAMIMVGPAGEIVLANQAAEALFRRERGDLLGESFQEVASLDVRALAGAEAGEDGEGPPDRPIRTSRRVTARRPDGTDVEIEVEVTPVRMGRELHVLASLFDRDARADAEEEIRTLSRRLARAEARLREES